MSARGRAWAGANARAPGEGGSPFGGPSAAKGRVRFCRVSQWVKNRATNDEWRVYYERADGLRAVVGDPFKRRMERATVRERFLLFGSALFVMALSTGFYLLTRP